MILTVVSPDKLSLSMFMDFYTKIYAKLRIVDLNNLYSDDMIRSMLMEARDKTKDLENISCLVKFKTKPNTPPSLSVPDPVLNLSDFVIRFSLYSNTPEVRKSVSPEILDPVIERWNKNIELMDKT